MYFHLKLMVCFYLMFTHVTYKSRDFSLKAPNPAVHSLFWNYLENIRARLQNKTYSQPVVCRACVHNTKHTRLLTLLQCRYNIFTPPLPSVLCLAHAHTGIGKAIVSNCHAQDFDYTLALKAQDCKRTIAQRALSSRRCNFNPFLMREHTKR